MIQTKIMRPYFDLNINYREDRPDDRAVINEMFIENVYRLEGHKLRDKAVVLDIGANIGTFTLQVLKLAQETNKVVTIYAVEPEKNNLEILKKNLEDNPLLFKHGSSVEIIECGVSDFMGESHITDEAGGSRLTEAPDSQEIDVVTYDHLIDQLGLDDIDFVKIDIEGSEVPLIKGAKKENLILAHYYAIEYDRFNKPQDFLDTLKPFLSDFDFQTWGVPKQGCNLYLENHHWSGHVE